MDIYRGIDTHTVFLLPHGSRTAQFKVQEPLLMLVSFLNDHVLCAVGVDSTEVVKVNSPFSDALL